MKKGVASAETCRQRVMGISRGSMELGDSFEDCARREVQEETGLICGNLEHFMNVSGEEVHYVYPNGDEIYAAEEIFYAGNFPDRSSASRRK